MAKPRIVIPGLPHHITQRGNYQQKVFFRDEDRRLYTDLLREFSRHHGVSILAWCLMSNHVHLIAVPHRPDSLARFLQRVHSEYARALHLRLRRSGHLWQARFHSTLMDENHFWANWANDLGQIAGKLGQRPQFPIEVSWFQLDTQSRRVAPNDFFARFRPNSLISQEKRQTRIMFPALGKSQFPPAVVA